jgi:long-chain acyl-CoA synthetase
VAQKYADVIEALYSGQDAAELSTAVTYEDGRQATVRSRVHMADVELGMTAGVPAHA